MSSSARPHALVFAAALVGGCADRDAPSIEELRRDGHVRFDGVELHREPPARLVIDSRPTTGMMVSFAWAAVCVLFLLGVVVYALSRGAGFEWSFVVPPVCLALVCLWATWPSVLKVATRHAVIDAATRQVTVERAFVGGLLSRRSTYSLDATRVGVTWTPGRLYRFATIELRVEDERVPLWHFYTPHETLAEAESLRDYLHEAGIPEVFASERQLLY